ncbi:MAG TPA: hypothetical protein VMU77_06100 [Acidimicrobiales bacterium]|nr:hypothetical protein [Acidimicrobiales bacterium]
MPEFEDSLQLAKIEHFNESARLRNLPGVQLQAIRDASGAFKSWFRQQGECSGVRTCHLIGLPYPRRFGLWRAAISPAPFLRIANRMMVVQFKEADPTIEQTPEGTGYRTKTMLVEPTEYELAANTPFFSTLGSKVPSSLRNRVLDIGKPLQEHLSEIGISFDSVDYLTFDHLHTQDLRIWLGTTEPQPDLVAAGKAIAGEPVEPLFPNAKLLVMRDEWEQLTSLHPMQTPWYQSKTFSQLRTSNVVVLDNDVLVGPGVALLHTPGHTPGNHTIVLNTASGIWTQSENGIHAECYTPERSKIPGLARHARNYGQEVILNANTPDFTATQYNSMVKEKLIADRGGPGGEWVQHFPSSELTAWSAAPGVSPSFVYGGITHGVIETK